MKEFFEDLKGIWRDLTLAVTIVVTGGFVIYATLGKLCIGNLPYLVC